MNIDSIRAGEKGGGQARRCEGNRVKTNVPRKYPRRRGADASDTHKLKGYAMTELQAVLINRDDMSAEEAADTIFDIRRRVLEGEDPEEILHNELGLEPDYIFDIL